MEQRNRCTGVCCVVLLAVLAGAATASAADSGSIEGTVVDPQGAAVASVTVTLLREGRSTGVTMTNARGGFVFQGLAESRYQMETNAPGFEPKTTDPIFVGATGR